MTSRNESDAEHPSGRQFVLTMAGANATITEVGGGLRALRIDGVEVLNSFAENEICDGARGQTLLPWPTRVAGGSYT